MRDLDNTLARLFELGTWLACAVVVLGLLMHSTPVVIAGIAAIIALPAAGLLVILGAFAWARDLRGALIALLVLAVLAVSLALA